MGQDLDFYDVYNAVNAERAENGEQPLTVSEFVKEYFGYISSEAEEAQKKQALQDQIRSLQDMGVILTRSI